MSNGASTNPGKGSSPLDRKQVEARARARFYRAIDYLSIYAFILVVYGAAVLADYLLFLMLWSLLREHAQLYPLIAQALDYARMGLALLFILAALIHGCISTAAQIRLDVMLAREEVE